MRVLPLGDNRLMCLCSSPVRLTREFQASGLTRLLLQSVLPSRRTHPGYSFSSLRMCA